MSAETEQRKLAAIMFTDMVGYSALTQRDEKLAQELLEEHRRLLREIFPRSNGTEIKTIGDAFLVEFGSALEAAQCAMAIQRALAHRNADAPADRQIQVRIGVHIGDVVHRGGDVYGDGVNIASRIESLAAAGGICVSMDVERQIRNALEARFEKLAPTELKNISVPMDLFRIVLPWERPGTPVAKTQARPKSTSQKFVPSAIALILLLIIVVAWWTAQQRRHPASPAAPSTVAVAEKSIAVLPFENLSRDPDNAFFTDGVQDEILSDLAKVADLKVISRTSVMQYRNASGRNLREIGRQLGVAHLLEGSVQRAANKIRVIAQLIDARNDVHLWGQTYDRDLADVFAIQTEIAQAIASQLQARISPSEKAAISQPPTTDLTANTLYLEAKELEFKAPQQQSLLQAVDLLEAAIARDPNFMLAYCMLGRLQLTLYWGGYDHTPARRELANTAIQNAVRLQPDAGEVHLALAWYAYQGFRDYDRARAELDLARRTLPNNADIYFVTALIDRRQSRWAEAARNLERAVELDPRNFGILDETAWTYRGLRRYSDAIRLNERALAVSPRDYFARSLRGLMPFFERADITPLRTELAAILTEEPAAAEKIADVLFRCAMAERDSAAVNRALAAIPPEGISPYGNFIYPREWFAGVAARTFNDPATARTSFSAARVLEEKITRDQPDYAQAWSLLGRIDAALGRKEDAIREGRRACELLPLSKDAGAGAGMITNLALIYAWAGEKDLALEQLAVSARIPNGVTYGELKLDPQWDLLRADPRFDKIVASLAPKQ